MSDISYKNDRCPWCETPYGDDRDENGRGYCECVEAENERLDGRLAEALSELATYREQLAAKDAEIERLRGIIFNATSVTQNWPGGEIRLCCDSGPDEEHEPECSFYQWEGDDAKV